MTTQFAFDAEGYDADGFNVAGKNREGYDRQGWNQRGLNKDGIYKTTGTLINRSGYDAAGYHLNGFNKAGFDRDGFMRDGFSEAGIDRDGFMRDGFNKAGFDRQGFNHYGFNRQSIHSVTGTVFNDLGLDTEAYGMDGLDKYGYDRNGLDKYGYDEKGYDRNGLNAEGLDRFNSLKLFMYDQYFNLIGITEDTINLSGNRSDYCSSYDVLLYWQNSNGVTFAISFTHLDDCYDAADMQEPLTASEITKAALKGDAALSLIAKFQEAADKGYADIE